MRSLLNDTNRHSRSERSDNKLTHVAGGLGLLVLTVMNIGFVESFGLDTSSSNFGEVDNLLSEQIETRATPSRSLEAFVSNTEGDSLEDTDTPETRKSTEKRGLKETKKSKEQANSQASKTSKELKKNQAPKTSKELKKNQASKTSKESKKHQAPKASKEPKEHKTSKEQKTSKEHKLSKEPKISKEHNLSKESKTSKEHKVSKDSKISKEHKLSKEPKVSKEHKVSKEPKKSKGFKTAKDTETNKGFTGLKKGKETKKTKEPKKTNVVKIPKGSKSGKFTKDLEIKKTKVPKVSKTKVPKVSKSKKSEEESGCTEAVLSAEQESFDILDKLRDDLLPFVGVLTGNYLVFLTDFLDTLKGIREDIDTAVDCGIVLRRLQNADIFQIDETAALEIVVAIIETALDELEPVLSVFEETSEEGGTGIDVGTIQEAIGEVTELFEELKEIVENDASLSHSPSTSPSLSTAPTTTSEPTTSKKPV